MSAGARQHPPDEASPRSLVARAFTWVEDVMYIGLGLVLSVAAISLLVDTAVSFANAVSGGTLPGGVIAVLDRVLLMLMIVELLYTVQLSFREHALVPEPFLIVGLVASVRRILVLTAEMTGPQKLTADVFQLAMIELGVLTGMILVFVASLLIIRRRVPDAMAARA